MPIEPPEDERSESSTPGTQASSEGGAKPLPPPLERSRFGGTERRAAEVDTPVSRSDLSKGPQELIEHRTSRTNWRVLIISSVVILAFSVWAIFMPDDARTSMKSVVDWIALNLGWYYVVTVTLVIGFVLWVAFSKEGNVRLGPDHSRPQYKLGTWVAMLFAAGVGIDMLFYSVTGPVVQYLHPPTGDGATAAALQDAVVWTMFHYGVATSMGIGVVLLSVGFSLLFGLEQGLTLQIGLVIGAVVLTIGATTSGVDRGIRWISELNLWSAVAMMLYILFSGETAFLLNALTENIGRFIVTLPARTLQTFAYEPGGSEWMGGWTLFFWAFWLAWGPLSGCFWRVLPEDVPCASS